MEADSAALLHALGGDADPYPSGTKDPEFVMATTRGAKLGGPLETLSGTAVGSRDWASVGALVEYIDTGGAHPVAVVFNQGTKANWPAAWGKPYSDDEPPAFALARHAPNPLVGVRTVVHARALQLPYANRRQYFAVDVSFP
jgi:hypothetical protein